MEERISGVEDMVEEMDKSAKENLKSGTLWKDQNIRIIRIEEEETHFKGPENDSNRIIGEKLPNLKKEIPMKVQEAYRTPKSLK